MYDDIEDQTREREIVGIEDDAARGAGTADDPGVSYLAYAISSGTSGAPQTTYVVQICEILNDETEGTALATEVTTGEVDPAPRRFLAVNVGTARPTLFAGTPGQEAGPSPLLVHRVGDRFAFDYS
jgi:hypothetical protein